MTDKGNKVQKYKEDFFAALMLLTRIPVSWEKISPDHPPDMARCLWAYPLIGLVLGLLAAMSFYGFIFIGIPISIAAILLLVVMVFLTGAFHEDGLADTADGFGGGQNSERKLKIMRDSRIGAYGALALILAFAVKLFSLLELTVMQVMQTILVASVVSRLMIVYMLFVLDPARKDSLSTQSGKPTGNVIIFTTASAFLYAGVFMDILMVLIMFLLASTVMFLFSRLAKVQVGGYSGDILGATQQLTEISVLVCAASMGSV